MTVTFELRAGRTPRGEVTHAVWANTVWPTYSPLCGRHLAITRTVDDPRSPTERLAPRYSDTLVSCVGCLRALREADRAAMAVMESVLHEQHGICQRCGRERWTLCPFSSWGHADQVCLPCREGGAMPA